MKRSMVLGAWSVACVAMALAGCSEPPAPPAAQEATHVISPRHEEVTLATVAPSAPSAPSASPSPTVSEGVVSTPRPRLPAREGALSLHRLVITTEIVDREPSSSEVVVDADEERVYAFVEVANPGDAETLVVTFTSDDGERVVGQVDVAVPAHVARWRTWAFTRHLSPGAWHAEIHTEDGRLVGDRAFDVE